MKILVTGAGGFVGRHLTAKLRADGHAVLVLRRGPGPSADDVFEGPADLADLDEWPRWPADIEAVAHLAGLNPTRRDPASRDPAALRRANVEGTAALARRARREGVRRIVFVSSASVHASSATDEVAEIDPLAPRSFYAISKAEGERAFWDALAGGGTEGCVLRPAPVFGPGGRNAVAALARLARKPLPLPLSGLGAPRSLVGVDSLVSAIALCLAATEAAGRAFLVADDEPLTPADVVSAFREGTGRAPMILPAPTLLVGLTAGAFGKGAMWRAATGRFVVDARSIRETLGWRPANARSALAAMAADGRL